MQSFQRYIRDVVAELKKVTWPTWEELKGSTMVVIFFSVVMGLYIALLDVGLSRLLKTFLG
ncbi:MAG: preprotein translocase subunit SecE [Fibromonadales bacterium]|nr:preprotein translocase subunit SecE [Fibromonadales bacterium]